MSRERTPFSSSADGTTGTARYGKECKYAPFCEYLFAPVAERPVGGSSIFYKRIISDIHLNGSVRGGDAAAGVY
jgi:hypothetical protein